MNPNSSEKKMENSQPMKAFSRTNLVYVNGSDVDEEEEKVTNIYNKRNGPKNQIYLDEKFAAKDIFA